MGICSRMVFTVRFLPLYRATLGRTGFLCFCEGGGTFVVVFPSKRARVGFGNADAFVSEHLHVVFGFAPFGPPLFDRLAGLDWSPFRTDRTARIERCDLA